VACGATAPQGGIERETREPPGLGRWAFAELTEIYQIDADFKAKVERRVDKSPHCYENPSGGHATLGPMVTS
jgi:hypothetical protein